jgi:hypothetical protein
MLVAIIVKSLYVLNVAYKKFVNIEQNHIQYVFHFISENSILHNHN